MLFKGISEHTLLLSNEQDISFLLFSSAAEQSYIEKEKQSQLLSSEQRECPRGTELSPGLLKLTVKEVWRDMADKAQGQAPKQRQGSRVGLGPIAWRVLRSYRILLNHTV